jgi:general secretion pathway protein A
MYRKFYGLQKRPFELAPDGNIVYLSEAHREAIATLRYGVIADKGFLLLTGGVGTGKTTMLNNLLGMLKDKVRLCVLNNPTLSRHEFLYFLAGKLGVGYEGNKGEFILQFSNLLENCEKTGEKVLLIIDEAQVFPIELLEEIRLLSNLAEDRNVLSIFLIGQPELQEKLAHPQLLPLRQRIGIRYHLKPLLREDTAQYISYRLNRAGADNPAIFSKQAIDCIHEASRGNPRLINVICDHALLSGFTQDMPQIDGDVVFECLKDIRLQGEESLQVSELQKIRLQGEDRFQVTEQQKKSEGMTGRLGGGNRSMKTAIAILVVLALALSASLLYFIVLEKKFPGIPVISAFWKSLYSN